MMLILGIVGSAPSMLSPVIAGALASRFRLPADRVGWALSAMLAGFAGANIVLSILLRLIGKRTLLAASAVLMGVASALILAAQAYAPAVAALFLFGFGGGGILGTTFAIYASDRAPDRRYALQFAATTAAMIAIFPAISAARDVYGAFGIFVAFAVAAGVAAVLAFLLPSSTGTTMGTPRLHLGGTEWRVHATIAAIAFVSFAGFSVWSFVERVGIAHGYPNAEVGQLLGLAALAGLVAGLSASWLGTRLGRALPTLIALAGMALATCGIATSWAYPPGALLFYASWLVVMPYLLGLLAALDPTGRAVAAATAFQNAGMALAPAVAGSLMVFGGFTAVLTLALVGYLLTAILAFSALSGSEAVR
jgi:MFS family permease